MREPRVNNQIAPGDGMLVDNPDGIAHYFAVGRSALHCIRVSMLAAGIETFQNILDLPCGQGRVLRHLQSAFPHAQLTACDIDREGVDFCAVAFGATPVYGHTSPSEIPLQGSYDLIWVGSLLTHLNSHGCAAFLEVFRTNLRRKGLLVFTIHGREVADRMRRGQFTYGLDANGISRVLKQYATEGFGYESYPTTTPGVGENYGISLISPGWVFSEIEKTPDLQLLNYTEKGWDNHQDVVTLMRT